MPLKLWLCVRGGGDVGEVCQVVVRGHVGAGTPGKVSTGCCLTLNRWCVCEHVCVRTHACVYPSGTDCSGFPTVRRGGRGRKDGLLLPSSPEASSECAQCTCVLGGLGRTGYRYMKTVEVSVRPPPSIFSSFRYKPMLPVHCLPSPRVCVCVRTHNLTNIGFCVCV